MADGVGHVDATADHHEGGPISLRTATVYGVIAGVGTYVAAVLFLGVHVVAMANTTIGGVGARAFLFGTLGDFFGSHLGVTDGVVLGVAGVGTVPVVVYYLVPVLLLGWCGRQCAASTTAASDQEAFLQGASVVAGYVLVVALALAVLYAVADFPLVAVDPLRSVLLAGLVYPLVFGGLGGYTTRLE